MSEQAIGPANRTTFHAEQARRRRRAAGWALLCLALAAGIGAVLSAVTGPLLLLLAAAALKLLAWLGVAPGLLLDALHGLEAWIAPGVRAASRGMDLLEAAEGPADIPAALGALLGGSGLLMPGVALALLLWAGLARFYRRSAIASAAAGLDAREPRAADLEERQFGNILAEMALAAGLPTPRLMLVDAPEPNAAAFGASHRDAALIATRGLLDALDRRETQGVVAHLVAATGSGDLRLAAAVQAVFGTLGALLLVFDLPFRRGAWTTLRDLVVALTGRLPAARAERLNAGLAASLSPESMDAMLRVMSIVDRWPPLGALVAMPLLPWMLLTLLQKTLVGLWMLFVFGWPLALLWRTRRHLADAVAVQLLRDPEALAAALRRIDAGALPPGGALHELGFFHAPRDGRQKGFRDRLSIATPLTPGIGRRLARLEALGAGPAPPVGLAATLAGLRRSRGWQGALVLLLAALLVPLVAALAVLVGGMMVACTLLSLVAWLGLVSLILQL